MFQVSLGKEKVIGLFLVLGCGSFLALIAFITEMAVGSNRTDGDSGGGGNFGSDIYSSDRGMDTKRTVANW